MGGTHTYPKFMRTPPLGAEASFICLHYIKTKQNSNAQWGSGPTTPQIQGRRSIHLATLRLIQNKAINSLPFKR